MSASPDYLTAVQADGGHWAVAFLRGWLARAAELMGGGESPDIAAGWDIDILATFRAISS